MSLVEIPRDLDHLPDFEKLREVAAQLHALNSEGKILSLHHIGQAGIAAAIAKMSFGNGIGVVLETNHDLYQECYFSFLIEHEAVAADSIRQALPSVEIIGQTTSDFTLNFPGESHPITTLQSAWTGTLEPIYPTQAPASSHGELSVLAVQKSPTPRSPLRAPQSKPKVLIPAFPGTNSEYDSAKAFREAGADAQILVFRNLTTSHIEESLTALAQQIRDSQILMFPGGFSAGDEPDGSAKFIATIIRSPRIADAIMDLLKNRDGLILGICNGFQALIKTGLVPYGKIDVPSVSEDGRLACSSSDAPTLVHNSIGRHISCYAQTRVVSNLSPWLSNSQIGDIHRIPLSHGEGKFYASDAVISQLAAKGQIATQYCDSNGTPSMDIAINPNGSLHAVEGITSPCGRVFGKMGHTERAGRFVAKNIPGNKHQPIFSAGVKYFC